MTSGYRASVAAAVLLLPTLTLAQNEATTAPEIDVVTIIGERANVADIPGSAHVIDQKELADFAQSDILRVLRSVPGVYVQEEEGFGLRPNIGIRGSGLDRSARIALLEDGVLIAPAPYAASSAYYFPTQRRMSAVEVLKGPASVAVGPRTTGGAMNMISTPIPDALRADADIRVANNDSLDAHVNVGNRGTNFGWLFETVQASSDGFKSITGPVGGNTGFDLEDYIVKLQFDSDSTSAVYQSVRVKLGFTDQRSNETYVGLTDADFAANPYYRYAASANDNFRSEHEQYQATYVIDADRNWRGEVTVYRNNFARNWYKVQSVGGVGLTDVFDDPAAYAAEYGYLVGSTSPDDAIQIRANNRDYYSQGVQAKIEWNLSVAKTDISLAAGVRLHRDEEDRFQHQDGYRIEDGVLVLTTAATAGSQTNRVSDATVTALFIDSQIRNGKWIFTPGVRFEDIELRRYDYAIDDPARVQGATGLRSNTVQVVIPGGGMLYRINDEWRVLAGVHKGFNPPAPGSSANEESSINFEAGMRYSGDTLSAEAIYFLNDYDNLVGTVTDSTGGGSQIGDQFDGGKAIVSGLELSTGYELSAGSLDIPISLKYTWTREAEFENSFDSSFAPWGDVAIGDELPYIPEHQWRAALGIEQQQFHVNLAATYVAKMRTVAGQDTFVARESISSHVVWDLMATWDFSNRLSTYLKVDNLLDEIYVASRRPAGLRPGSPRTAYLGFTISL